MARNQRKRESDSRNSIRSHDDTNHEHEFSTESNDESATVFSRRRVLQSGVATASLAALGIGATDVVRATTEDSGITFDRVVNIVDDLGGDPTGSKAIDNLIKDAEREGTLIEFPAGEYRVKNTIDVSADRFGLRGAGDGQTRFVPPTGFRNPLVEVRGQDDFLFKGIDIECEGRSASIIVHCRHRFHVEDVEFHGRGANSGYAWNFAIDDPDGTGILRDGVAKHGSDPSDYNGGNGRIGVWVGLNHKGTVRVENCDIREFGNNGMYAGRTPGNVQVIDSYFLNNNVAAVRISGKDSYVENCLIEVDFRKYDGPLAYPESGFNCRGVVGDQKRGSSTSKEFPPKDGPMEVRNSTININHTPTDRRASQGAISIWGTSRMCRVTDTVINVDVDGVPAIHRERPGDRGNFRSDMADPPAPYWVELERVVITGVASRGEALDITGAHGSKVTDCCIIQSGSNRDGAKFVNTDNGSVSFTNISVSDRAVRTENSTVTTEGITADDQCSVSVDGATDSGGSTDSSDSTDSGGSTDSSDSTDSGGSTDSSEPQFDHLLEVISAENADTTPYEVVVSGEAQLVTEGEYASTPGYDSVTDNGDGTYTLAGIVARGGGDSYEFDGEVLSGTIDGDATAYVDGTATPLKAESVASTHLLEVISAENADTTPYEVVVSGEAQLVTEGEYASTPGYDSVTDNGDGTYTLAGIVARGGGDSYEFDGEVLGGVVDGDATAYVDGTATQLGPYELPNTLTVLGSSLGEATYSFGVSGDLRVKRVDGSATVENDDTVASGMADGVVGDDTDVYTYSGEVTDLTLDGPAAVFINGDQVDPALVGTSEDPVLPNRVVVSAQDGSSSEYTFEVTGSIEKSPDLGSMEATDDLGDGSVTGVVTGDTDGYRFSGDLTISEVDGAMSIDLDEGGA